MLKFKSSHAVGLFTPVLFMNIVAITAVMATTALAQVSLKDKRICRSCGELAKLVQARLEKTAAEPRVIEVAGRIGADGRPIPSRRIDYLNS